MRNWQNLLYLGPMPGRKLFGLRGGHLEDWLGEMAAEGIVTVVCLVPDGDIERESPDYAEWRRANRSDPQWTLFDVPIRDFAAPDPGRADEFRRVVSDVASLVAAGSKVYVHCSAGIGRTGTFAAAVLLALGYRYEDAVRHIRAAGSEAESPAQREFLEIMGW